MQENIHNQGWLGFLSFTFEPQCGRTVVKDKRHKGPLVVQRPYYQEKSRPTVLIIHPPGGVVGGDVLDVNILCQAGSEALVSTPAATKFYRSERRMAVQKQVIQLTDNVSFEWLPQETLFFNSSWAENCLKFELSCVSNRLIAWDIVGLGRPAAGEGFEQGQLQQNLEVWVGGKLVFLDRLRILPESHFLGSSAGMAGFNLLATALFYCDDESTQKILLETLQAQAWSELVGVTRLDNLIVLRVLSNELDALKTILYQAWVIARPMVLGIPAIKPRIWNT